MTGAIGAESSAECWLARHRAAFVWLTIAAGFLVRLVFARQSFFNPDEALLAVFSNQDSLVQVYRNSIGTAHPPLLLFLLWFWHVLGNSELVLRLPSVLAGTAACWFLFKWMELAFSRAAGFAALVLAACSPTLVGTSIEVRQYALLLFVMAAALYLLEAALQENSALRMCWFHLFLYAAILTHYSAVFFVLAAGGYALVRLPGAKPAGRLVATWVAGQLGAVAIYAIL